MSKYNEFPIDWREISNEEFTRIFFMYCKEPLEFRQMFRTCDGEARPFTTGNLFSITGTLEKFSSEGLGIAIFRDGYQSKFAKFGREDDWWSFESGFAAQFRGDNS